MDLFAEISVLIAIAAAVAVIMRLLGQPLIIGHIITGLIVGPSVFNIISSEATLSLMSELGVAILLFTVGLHLSPEIFKQFGRVAFLTGLGQVIASSLLGFGICIALGFTPLVSFYIATALAFSSTIIVMKLIADRGDLEVLYAKIAIGFLLVQDLIAVLLLLGIPLFSVEDATPLSIAQFALTGAALIGFVVLASRFFISKQASAFLAESREFLFLFAITWGMGVAALFKYLGFSLESGALIAGVALATLPARYEISARLTPLRDFFVVIFFIFLGANIHLADVTGYLPVVLALSLLVLVGKPVILLLLTSVLGYRRKTSLQTGFTVAQISEFSLILVALGVSLGHVPVAILSLVTLVGIITIFGSTYLVQYQEVLYELCAPYLKWLERSRTKAEETHAPGKPIVLIGCGRIGYDFLDEFAHANNDILVIDYNPETVSELTKRGIATEFGDAGDPDFLDAVDFSNAELVISTIPEAGTNHLIHNAVKAKSRDAVVMVVAHRIKEALTHYDDGIDYVILPHFLGGKYAAELVIKFKDNKAQYEVLRKEQIRNLQLRVTLGHEHPTPSAIKM